MSPLGITVESLLVDNVHNLLLFAIRRGPQDHHSGIVSILIRGNCRVPADEMLAEHSYWFTFLIIF